MRPMPPGIPPPMRPMPRADIDAHAAHPRTWKASAGACQTLHTATIRSTNAGTTHALSRGREAALQVLGRHRKSHPHEARWAHRRRGGRSANRQHRHEAVRRTAGAEAVRQTTSVTLQSARANATRRTRASQAIGRSGTTHDVGPDTTGNAVPQAIRSEALPGPLGSPPPEESTRKDRSRPFRGCRAKAVASPAWAGHRRGAIRAGCRLPGHSACCRREGRRDPRRAIRRHARPLAEPRGSRAVGQSPAARTIRRTAGTETITNAAGGSRPA